MRHAKTWTHHRRFIVATLLVTLAFGCPGSTLYQLKLKPFQLEGLDFKLPSGLRLFFQEDQGQPSVNVSVMVGSGASSDPAGREGLAHLVEHLCFRARHGDAPSVWDHLQILGAQFNGFTNSDSTVYLSNAPMDSLPALLAMEGQRLSNPLEGVTPEILAVEREVVRNELRQRNETTMSNQATDNLFEMLYPVGHPYHRAVGGSHDSLSRITLEDARAFVKAHYRPDNATVVVVGAFDRQQLAQVISRALPPSVVEAGPNTPARAENTPRIHGASAEPPPPVERKPRHIHGPVSTTTIYLAWSLPGSYRGQDALMRSAVGIMPPAVGSLLFPESLHEAEKIDGLGCFLEPGIHSSLAICEIEVAEGKDADTVAQEAINGLWELWNGDASNMRRRFLAESNASVMTSVLDGAASIERATTLVADLHFINRPDVFSRTFAELGQVRETDVRDLAFKYLNRQRAVILVVEPPVAGGPEGHAVEQAAHNARGEDAEMAARFASLTPQQIEHTAVTPDLKQFKTFTLSNGLKVVIKRHGSAPFVKVALTLGGGLFNASPAGLPLLAMPRHEARTPLEVAGRWMEASLEDTSLMGVAVPSGNLAAALDMVATRASTTHSTWTELMGKPAYNRLERSQHAEDRLPTNVARKRALELLTPSHPLARQRMDLAGLKNAGRSNMDTWFQKTLAPANATLLVVGDVDLAQAEQEVTARFSSWRAKDPGEPYPSLPPLPTPPARRLVLVDRKDATQAELMVLCQAEPFTAKNELPLAVTTRLLTDELMHAMRVGAGATYGIYASSNHFRGGPGYFTIGGAVQNDRLVETLTTTLNLLQELAAGHVDNARLNQTKWDLARDSQTEFLGNERMLMEMFQHARLNQPTATFRGRPLRLALTSAQDVAQQLGRCAGHEIIALVTSRAAVEGALQGLNIPIENLAASGH